MPASKAVSPALAQPPLLDEPKRAAVAAPNPKPTPVAEHQPSGFAKAFKALTSHFSRTNVNVSGVLINAMDATLPVSLCTC